MMKEKSMIFITVKLVIAVLLTFIAIELYITGADTESFHKFTLYGRRKEKRIEIGKRNSARFGLTSPEQTVFVNGIKMQQPCAVVDARISCQLLEPIHFVWKERVIKLLESEKNL